MNKLIFRFLSGKAGARLEIRILLSRTSKVFGVKPPKSAGLSTREQLQIYAKFSASETKRSIQSRKDLKPLRRDLYHMAYRLGKNIRLLAGPKNEQESFAILSLLYRNIGISIKEESHGQFCVSKCYFSNFYSPAVCSVISAIDKGIFAGIYNGGELKFYERITEGNDVCRAVFDRKG